LRSEWTGRGWSVWSRWWTAAMALLP